MKFKAYLTLQGATEIETPLVDPKTNIPIILEGENAVEALSKIWVELVDKFRAKKDSFGIVTVTGIRIARCENERKE